MARGSASTAKRDRASSTSSSPSSDHVDRIVAEWAKELPHLDTDAVALIGRLMRASRLLKLEVDRSLGTFDLTINEILRDLLVAFEASAGRMRPGAAATPAGPD